mmetsp:Transcript_35036/g.92010  ORF Transcript_35036/g.92010 Transcript_35036/m.92010 type:complete len:281 (-) Transcript_35036:142-984(-)
MWLRISLSAVSTDLRPVTHTARRHSSAGSALCALVRVVRAWSLQWPSYIQQKFALSILQPAELPACRSLTAHSLVLGLHVLCTLAAGAFSCESAVASETASTARLSVVCGCADDLCGSVSASAASATASCAAGALAGACAARANAALCRPFLAPHFGLPAFAVSEPGRHQSGTLRHELTCNWAASGRSGAGSRTAGQKEPGVRPKCAWSRQAAAAACRSAYVFAVCIIRKGSSLPAPSAMSIAVYLRFPTGHSVCSPSSKYLAMQAPCVIIGAARAPRPA